MKIISIYKEQSEQTMTSLEIAELTGKQHKNIMQAIRNMEPAWEKVNGLKFQLVEYKDAKGELRPCYQLTKTENLYIATKFNDEARARLVLRWQELELREQKRRQQLALPSPKKMSSYNFNAVLRDMGIQYRRHSRWNICEELEERGLTVKKSVKSVESVVKKAESAVNNWSKWSRSFGQNRFTTTK